MKNLREQLLKANLVTEKQVRQAAHADRVERKEKGAEGLRADRSAREQEQTERLQEQREQDRRREKEQAVAGAAAADPAGEPARRSRADAVRLAADSGRVLADLVGSRRFYFVDRRGRIPFLEISDSMIRRLSAGECAVVEIPSDHPLGGHVVVDARTGRLIRGIDAEAVRFQVTGPPPKRD